MIPRTDLYTLRGFSDVMPVSYASRREMMLARRRRSRGGGGLFDELSC